MCTHLSIFTWYMYLYILVVQFALKSLIISTFMYLQVFEALIHPITLN